MKTALPIEVVPYSENYTSAHRIFSEKMWPTKPRRQAADFVRWKFRGRPHGEVPGLLLAVREGKVVGQVGLIPATLKNHNKTQPCQWVCDFMVDQDSRGQGVGSLLLRKAVERDMITLGLNPTPSSLAAHSRVGFTTFSGPKMMLLPLKLNEMLRWKINKNLWSMVPALAVLGWPVIRFRSRKLYRGNGLVNVQMCPWEDVVDLIQARQNAFMQPHIAHDFGFLSWRCKPPKNFRQSVVGIRTSSGGYALIEVTPLCLFVSDWFAKDENDKLELFQAIYLLARQSNSEMIQVLAYEEQKDWFSQVGFLEVRRSLTVLLYPSAFRAEYENMHLSLMDSDSGDM